VILVTGGAGFIGSHTCVALAAANIPFLVLDNFCNSRASVLKRVESIIKTPVPFVEGDVRDAALLQRVFAQNQINAVVHFAALKSVGKSVHEPLRYYDNNVVGTVNLLRAMQVAQVRTLVFSSSATVYGEPTSVPLREDAPLSTHSPYGSSKLMTEQVLADVEVAEPGLWRIARLRYFNPVGAHESGLIGEDPQDVPNNLLPYVAQVAVGLRERLSVYGGDYPTPDGTGVRDYIHVCDLAEGHVAALRYLRDHSGMLTVNLGTGKPVSVLEMVKAFERASGRAVPYQIVERRSGDVAQCWADPALAEKLLGWRAQHGIQRMCDDAWRWQSGVATSLQS
jgi:UDP-glucose 4-epimerase